MSGRSTRRWRSPNSTFTRSVVKKAADYKALAADPPCMHCEMRRVDHAHDKCLFGPASFQEPSHVYLRIFFRWGTYKHEGRHRRNRGGG